MPLTLDDFDYSLPPELIAQFPAPERAASRLLRLAARAALSDRSFADLPQFLRAGRRAGVQRHARDQGAPLRPQSERRTRSRRWWSASRMHEGAGAGARQPPAPARHALAASTARSRPKCSSAAATCILLRFGDGADVLELLERARQRCRCRLTSRTRRRAATQARYQTVYARASGRGGGADRRAAFRRGACWRGCASVGVQLAWLTLHVGAGTFQPVRVRESGRAQHAQRALRHPAGDGARRSRARARPAARVIAVGTTSLRALESAAAQRGETCAPAARRNRLFITPGYRFRVVDRLITNFHLPGRRC